jgi:hypothetical protein
VGDDSEKAFLMALLLINLYEFCETSRDYSGGLQHITLFEEAHRLLKNIPPTISAEGANPRGKAVEMFSDILSEIREYGEGFIIVDQVPAKLAPDALKNTNLKILHRIVAADDRESVGNAMNLSLEQKEHVVRLRVGQAIVHNEYLDEPILVQVKFLKDDLRQRYDAAIGEKGLKSRMVAMHNEVQAIHRRWTGCDCCDSPCSFLSKINAPVSAGQDACHLVIDAMLFGTLSTLLPLLKDLREISLEGLRRKFHRDKIQKGILYCHIVQTLHLCLEERLRYYGFGKGGYRSFLHLEKNLSQVIYQFIDTGKLPADFDLAVNHFRDEMLGEIHLDPKRQEVGCTYCKRRCQFGFMVQRDMVVKAKLLAGRLETAAKAPDFVGNFNALSSVVVAFSRDVTGFEIFEENRHDLAFCYLVNAGGTKKHILQGFQRVKYHAEA